MYAAGLTGLLGDAGDPDDLGAPDDPDGRDAPDDQSDRDEPDDLGGLDAFRTFALISFRWVSGWC